MVVADDSHNHVISNVDGLQTALDGKTTTSRTITAGDGLTGGGDFTANRTINVGAGSGITVTADAVSHADTSSQASVNNSNGTVIQDVTLDTYGHVTGLTSANLDGRYYTETEADSRFVNVTGDTVTGALNIETTGGPALTLKDTNGAGVAAAIYIDFDDSNGSRVGYVGIGSGGTNDIWLFTASGRPILASGNGSNPQYYNGSTYSNIFHEGYHPNADKWTTARTLSLSGDASGSVSWDGSANATLSVTVANNSHYHDEAGSIDVEDTRNAGARLPNDYEDHRVTAEFTDDLRGAWWSALTVKGWHDGYAPWSLIGHANTGQDTNLYFRAGHGSNNTWSSQYKIWHEGSDGSGSGLDADLLDGVQGSSFLRSDADDSMSGKLTFTDSGNDFAEYNGSGTAPYFRFKTSGTANGYIQFTSTGVAYFWNDRIGQGIKVEAGANGLQWYTGGSYRWVWHSGNDGSGSGLDADKLDGYHLSTTRNSANTVPVRDGNGYLQLGWINTTSGATTSTINKIYASYDDYVRYITPATFRSQVTDGSYVNVTGDTMTGDLTMGDNVIYGDLATTALRVGSQGYFVSVRNIEIRADDDDSSNTEYLLLSAGQNKLKVTSTSGAGTDNNKLTYNSNIVWHAGNDGSGSGLDADLWDGNQFSSYLNQAVLSTSSPSFAGLNINGNLNAVDNIYIAGNVYHEGDTDTYLEFGLNQIRLITGGSAEVTIDPTGVRLGDSGNAYVQPVSGNYGSFQIDGGAHGGWEGYSIGGLHVFMSNGADCGIYNDIDNEWMAYFTRNGSSYLYHNGSSKLSTSSTGVTVTGDLNSTSDIRYKKNIETIDNALEKVQSLRGVTFDWDHEDFNSDSRATGVIAQDVEKVLPEAVRENEDGFKNVAYGNMVGLLIEAIKEQQEQIDALKKQLNG
jgi:putative lipoic acid-binding regulatory protein